MVLALGGAFGVLVPSPRTRFQVYYLSVPGPAGRIEAVTALLAECGESEQACRRNGQADLAARCVLLKAKMQLEHTIAHGGWGAPVPSGKFEPGDTGEGLPS